MDKAYIMAREAAGDAQVPMGFDIGADITARAVATKYKHLSGSKNGWLVRYHDMYVHPDTVIPSGSMVELIPEELFYVKFNNDSIVPVTFNPREHPVDVVEWVRTHKRLGKGAELSYDQVAGSVNQTRHFAERFINSDGVNTDSTEGSINSARVNTNTSGISFKWGLIICVVLSLVARRLNLP